MSFDESWWDEIGKEIFRQVKAKDNLINELADALAGMKPISSSSPITSELEKESLVQRAREAARWAK
jgi:hypothetical protein